MKILIILMVTGIFCSVHASAIAAPNNSLIAEYNQAASSGKSMQLVLSKLDELKHQQAGDPLTLVYWGSAKTMTAKEEFWPWSKYNTAEAGLGAIDKSLLLLDNYNSQARHLGLDDRSLTQALAAITYTAVPKMFNRFERGYDLFITLLDSPQFLAVPAQYTSWVYARAIAAAINSEDLPRAKSWQQVLVNQAPTLPNTQQTAAMIAEAQGE